MRDLVIFFVHLLMIAARLASPDGFRSVVAESILVKHQLLILNARVKALPITPFRIAASSAGEPCL